MKIVIFLIFSSMVFSQTDIKITHLYHSGFLIEYDDKAYIFDYFPDQSSDEKTMQNGFIEVKYLRHKQLFVFISHEHKDHFYADAILWKNEIPKIHYFVSKEVAQKDERYKESNQVTVLEHDDLKSYLGLSIKTIRSSDSGVAFLIKSDGLTFYHSGDHASWNWQNNDKMNDDFINSIAAKLSSQKIDIAMHVFDTRLSKSGFGGFFHFINAYKPLVAIPMHAKGNYAGNSLIPSLKQEWNYENYIWQIKHAGEEYGVRIKSH